MPLYEYRCGTCGRRIEVMQRMTDAPLRDCPHCGGPLTKLLSAPALHFKGSGFYLTDYGRAGGGRKPGETSDKPAAAGDKPEPTKDAKPPAEAKPAADSKPAPAADKKAG